MEKNKNYKNSPIGYVIPQMNDSTVGLRSLEKKFESSDAASPLFGLNVRNELSSPTPDINNNVNKDYDPYREVKKISNEELISKHGTLYPEFEGIEQYVNNNNIKVYKKEEQVEQIQPQVQQVQPEVNMNFNIGHTEPQTSFNNVSYEAPKEDYSSKETKLPPFFFKRNTVEEETPKPSVTYSENYDNDEEKEDTYSNNTYVKPQTTQNEFTGNTQVTVEYEKKVNKAYVYPPLSLFDVHSKVDEVEPEFINENKEIINRTLQEFNIPGEVCDHKYGPTVTRYEIKLAGGVNVKKIPNIENTIKMNLSAKTIRIEAPIPGKPNVGIEVPNRKAQMVHFIDIIKDPKFQNSNKPLMFVLGKDIDGNSIYGDIEEMPHGLVGGATNSGKSVCINALITSLLLKNSPEDLKLILIDPKQVELSVYGDIPHLVTPVISDMKMAAQSLKWAVDEMEKRYSIFTQLRVRNIEGYNQKADPNTPYTKMPFIVIVIDELAELMLYCGSEVEDLIQRLTQKARAAGIHLIVATQRPTTDVVKGTIKANIPSRIAFRVSQFIDSNTILDQGGAETLLGKGDMLVKNVDGVTRVQGAYINGDDIERVTDFIKANNECNYIFSHDALRVSEVTSKGNADAEEDELLYNAGSFFIQKQTCSINALQQQFNFGFNRAQKVVESLEKLGIVSARVGTLAREVLVTQEQLDEIFNV